MEKTSNSLAPQHTSVEISHQETPFLPLPRYARVPSLFLMHSFHSCFMSMRNYRITGMKTADSLGNLSSSQQKGKKEIFFFPRPQLLLLFLFRVTLINLSTETQSREMSDGISRCACAVTNFRLSYNTVPYLYIIILKEEEEKNKITRWKILHTTNWNERRGSWCVMSLFYPLAGRLRPTV